MFEVDGPQIIRARLHIDITKRSFACFGSPIDIIRMLCGIIIKQIMALYAIVTRVIFTAATTAYISKVNNTVIGCCRPIEIKPNYRIDAVIVHHINIACTISHGAESLDDGRSKNTLLFFLIGYPPGSADIFVGGQCVRCRCRMFVAKAAVPGVLTIIGISEPV